MKLYRGLINVGKSPVNHQIKRGFAPMSFNKKNQQVIGKDADGKPLKAKDPLTAPEVLVLRKLFGHDSVTEIAEIGEDKALATQVRSQLEAKYGEKAVESVFGIRGAMPMPKALDLEEPDEEMAVDPDDPNEQSGGAAVAPERKRETLKLREAVPA